MLPGRHASAELIAPPTSTIASRSSARAPAFISWGVFGATAQGKGRDNTRVKGRAVIVVDQEDDIWLFLLHPLFGELETLENRTIVVVAGDALVGRDAQCRDVGTGNT